MSGFQDPIAGGDGKLVYPAIKSPDYVPGVSGWSVNKDGTAEFNNVDLRGTFEGNDWAINPNGFFFYNGTAALGTLAFAIAIVAGTDSFGNVYQQGYNVIGIADLTSAFEVLDTAGNTLAAIDAAGNITGQTISANDDVILAGDSLTGTLNGLAGGLVNYGYIGTPFPSSGGFGSGETALFELDQVVTGGRIYEFNMYPTRIAGSTSGMVVDLRLRITNDGTTPTTSSQLATSVAGNLVTSGGAIAHPGLRVPVFPTADGVYKFLVTGNCTSPDTYSFSVDPYIRCEINDLGANDNGQSTNNITILGTGTGGGTSKQTYTKTYSATATYSYSGSDGHYPNSELNVNGNLTQGGDYSDTYNGKTKGFIVWPPGIASDLSGATVNWVKLTLANKHSWWNSGMTVVAGVSGQSSFGSTQADPATPLNGQFSFSIGEGQTKTVAAPSSWFPGLQSGGTRSTVLFANSNNLGYYGYFAGGSNPKLTINYTK